MTTYKINDNGIERDMTEEETLAHTKTLEDSAKDQAKIDKAQADKATAKQAVLTKLGLTADEVTALLG
jgi:hypothetical protein